MRVRGLVLALALAGCRAPAPAVVAPPAAAPVAVPKPAPAPPEVTAIAAGSLQTCVLQGGEVRCWGGGECGSSGERTVEGLPPVRALVSRWTETCAVGVEGGVWCWSGNGPAERLVLPGKATWPRLDAVVDVAIDGGDICVNDSDGLIGCWDRDSERRLRLKPTPDYLPERVSRLAAGRDDFVAIVDGHSVRRWNRARLEVPVVAVVHADRDARALDGDGGVYCWALFERSRMRPRPGPVRVGELPAVAELVAGLDHFCARTRDGEVWCWGSGEYGQLGADR